MDAMDGAHAGHDHAGHDHSAHATAAVVSAGGMAAGHAGHADHTGVIRMPDGSYRYTHGAFTGHVVPGCFFLGWGLWWAVTTFIHYCRCLASRTPFRTRAWRQVPCGPKWLRQAPFEPWVKILLPLVGILGELWLGHDAYRPLYQPDGQFTTHLNDWQHSAMYLCFMASGAVDLVGHYLGAPPSTELAFLCLSFLAEGLLLVFHLKGPHIEVLVHLILGLQVFATVFAILAEMAVPGSILAASLRPWLAMVQGVWWIHTAYIMYTGAPQWDPDQMGGAMFVPVPFALHMLWLAAFMLLLLLVIKAITERKAGRPLSFEEIPDEEPHHQHTRLPVHDEPEAFGSLEMIGVASHKTAAD